MNRLPFMIIVGYYILLTIFVYKKSTTAPTLNSSVEIIGVGLTKVVVFWTESGGKPTRRNFICRLDNSSGDIIMSTNNILSPRIEIEQPHKLTEPERTVFYSLTISNSAGSDNYTTATP